MKPGGFLAPILILLTFALAACGGSGDSSTSTGVGRGASTTSEPSGNGLAPSGEAVRGSKSQDRRILLWPRPGEHSGWRQGDLANDDPVPHTATAEDGSFDTGPIEHGKLKPETFKQAGTYRYVCEIHPWMHGTVEVVEKE